MTSEDSDQTAQMCSLMGVFTVLISSVLTYALNSTLYSEGLILQAWLLLSSMPLAFGPFFPLPGPFKILDDNVSSVIMEITMAESDKTVDDNKDI